jgi:transcriptional regulator with XRE-family HTH domain
MTKRDADEEPTWARRFGAYVAEAARDAGYDIDSQRSGGRKALASATGMSPSSVGRMLAGEILPSPRFYGPLSKAIRRPLRDLLIESGTATEELLDAVPERLVPVTAATPEEAARLVGITKPASVRIFVGMVETLLAQEDQPNGDMGAA